MSKFAVYVVSKEVTKSFKKAEKIAILATGANEAICFYEDPEDYFWNNIYARYGGEIGLQIFDKISCKALAKLNHYLILEFSSKED